MDRLSAVRRDLAAGYPRGRLRPRSWAALSSKTALTGTRPHTMARTYSRLRDVSGHCCARTLNPKEAATLLRTLLTNSTWLFSMCSHAGRERQPS